MSERPTSMRPVVHPRVRRYRGSRRALCATALVVLTTLGALVHMSHAAAAGPREYNAFVGGSYAFGGTTEQLEERVDERSHSLALIKDPADASGTNYVTSGSYDSGNLNLGVAAKKWITSIETTGSAPASTTIDVQYSIDGGAFTNAPIETPLQTNSVRFRVQLSSAVPTSTPVLSGIEVAFYLEKPAPWTPPKKTGGKKGTGSHKGNTSGKTGGSGHGGGSGNGNGSGGSGTGVGIGTATGSGGQGGGGTGGGTGTGGGAPAGGSASGTGPGLVPAVTNGGGSVRGLLMSESDTNDAAAKGFGSAIQSASENPMRGLALGLPGLGLCYCVGLSWPAISSFTQRGGLARHSSNLANLLAALIAKIRPEA